VHVRIFHFPTIISGGYIGADLFERSAYVFVSRESEKKEEKSDVDDDGSKQQLENTKKKKKREERRGTERKIILCRPTPSFYLT
jgi:hypothetical protein